MEPAQDTKPLNSLFRGLSDYSFLIVLAMVATALAIFYFSQMRGASLSDEGQSASVFTGQSAQQGVTQSAPAQRPVSSLDFAPRMNLETPPVVERVKPQEEPAQKQPQPVPVQAPLPQPVAVQAGAKATLVPGSNSRQNSRPVAAGFSSFRDKEEKPKAPSEASPPQSTALGSQASEAAAQKVRQMMPLLQAIQQGGFQSLGVIKQRTYELQQIGRELLDASQFASTSTIRPGASHVYWEGSGPQRR